MSSVSTEGLCHLYSLASRCPYQTFFRRIAAIKFIIKCIWCVFLCSVVNNLWLYESFKPLLAVFISQSLQLFEDLGCGWKLLVFWRGKVIVWNWMNEWMNDWMNESSLSAVKVAGQQYDSTTWLETSEKVLFLTRRTNKHQDRMTLLCLYCCYVTVLF